MQAPSWNPKHLDSCLPLQKAFGLILWTLGPTRILNSQDTQNCCRNHESPHAQTVVKCKLTARAIVCREALGQSLGAARHVASIWSRRRHMSQLEGHIHIHARSSLNYFTQIMFNSLTRSHNCMLSLQEPQYVLITNKPPAGRSLPSQIAVRSSASGVRRRSMKTAMLCLGFKYTVYSSCSAGHRKSVSDRLPARDESFMGCERVAGPMHSETPCKSLQALLKSHIVFARL